LTYLNVSEEIVESSNNKKFLKLKLKVNIFVRIKKLIKPRHLALLA
jgi:hypothetical protein